MDHQSQLIRRCCASAVAALALISAGAGAQDRVAGAITTTVSDKPVPVDYIIAIVNDDAITRRELSYRLRTAERQLQAQGVALPPREVLERQVLDRMVTDRAITQWAKDGGIRVDEQMLDAAFANLAAQNNLSPAAFRERLVREGIDLSRFRTELREEIYVYRARDKEVDAKTVVTDAEIDTFLAEQTGVDPKQAELNIAQILIRPKDESAAAVAAARATAQALYERAKAGEDFARLAKDNSSAPEAAQGGELGYRNSERLPELFVNTVSGLKQGEVAAPVQSGAGFHVLKLAGKRSPGTGLVGSSAPQLHARHILLRLGPSMDDAQAQAQLEAMRAKILAGQATFEDLARANSVDASAAKGGDLGWLMAGDTVPEFEAAMVRLQPGEISAPVKSQFGWHLIQVTERDTRSVGADKQRQLARQILRDRKSEEQFNLWARQLRDRAYVELRLDQQ